MSKIAILPDILCNQIAAGEVVERPAAVAKELIENSIDAGSSRITVSLLHGGRKEVSVIDNGCGMHPDDALLAIERHATSKIRSSDDLQAIATLGFRGEALPSIASVSRFELVTREHDAVSGIQIRIEGGVLRDVRDKGCAPGTQVIVRDLFHNLPARRKFMRTPETELSYITDLFLRTALSRPEIHLQLISEEKQLYDFPKTTGVAQRAGQALGIDVVRSFTPLEFERNGVRVSGCVASPNVQRTNSQSLFLFVNGRPVWDRLLQRTVLTAYEALLPRGKYPVALIYIDISPSGVDVNVHPAKREIRFKNPGEVLPVVREAMMGALASARPKTSFSQGFAGQYPSAYRAPFQTPVVMERQAPFNSRPQTGFVGEDAPKSADFSSAGNVVPEPAENPEPAEPIDPLDEVLPEFSFASLRVIGQLANSYIILESPDGLVMIDQHAAHERVLFNALCSKSARPAGQRLAIPAIVHLMPKEAAQLKRMLRDLDQAGFEIEPFGGSSFAIHSLPAILSGISPEEIIRDLISAPPDTTRSGDMGLLRSLAKLAACHGALKAGQRLKEEEILALLEALDKTESPFTCPHGRPLWVILSHDQILRLFKRS